MQTYLLFLLTLFSLGYLIEKFSDFIKTLRTTLLSTSTKGIQATLSVVMIDKK